MVTDPIENRKLAAILFTDIVGSTRLKQELGEGAAVALIQRHHALIRSILKGFKEGQEIETAGDSFFIAFAKPSDAVKFALLVQRQLRAFAAQGHPIRDRIGIHVGEVLIGGEPEQGQIKAPTGIQVDMCARVMSLARGDQILMTRFAFDTARSVLKGADIGGVGLLGWMNHGSYLLKGIEEPVEICEVGEVGAGVLKTPPSSEKGQRHISAEGELVLGWRPALEQVVPNTKWTLEKKLGEGGFGEVWLGHHDTLKEKRVFKFCFRADRVRSLKREVTLFRVLKERVGHHPNIVGIQEVFFDAPPFYIVMDYAEGQELRAWCDAQGGADKIPLATQLEIAAQVADALQAAHEAGVIHRDVKPSNILISNLKSQISNSTSDPRPLTSDLQSPKLEVKLTDFGIGQVVSQEALAGMTQMGFTETMIGPGSSSHAGTQLYMAPELVAGQPASVRSDIYSLGVVVYQLLIGNFTRPLTTDWARAIKDPLLQEDLQRCFAGNPEERFSTASELAKNLRSLEMRQSAFADRRALLAAQERTTRRQKTLRTASAFIVMTALVTGLLVYAFTHTRQSKMAEVKRIAVMPFGFTDREGEYFAKQMSAELILRLSKIAAFNVTPLTRVLSEARHDQPAADLGRRLNVTTTVRGSAIKAGDRVRIEVKVVQLPDEKQLWKRSYDRDFKDIFKVQAEIVHGVARALAVRLSEAEKQSVEDIPTDNFLAYDFYLRGKSLGLQEGEKNNSDGIELLEKSVELDPDFAEARAELAHAYCVKGFYYTPGDNELLSKALLNATKAMAKKPNLAAAHYAQGFVLWTHSNGFNHKEAIKSYAQAIRLDPAWDDAYHQLGLIYIHLGLVPEALGQCDAAIQINPSNDGARFRRAGALMYGGRFKEALAAYREIEAFNPSIWASHTAILQIYLKQTDAAKATIDGFLNKLEFKADKGGQAASIEAILLAMAGQTNQAHAKIQLAIERGRNFGHWHHAAHFIADAYAVMNQPLEALHFLKQASSDGFPCYPLFQADPILESHLKDYPEFERFKEDLKKTMEEYRALDRQVFPSKAN